MRRVLVGLCCALVWSCGDDDGSSDPSSIPLPSTGPDPVESSADVGCSGLATPDTAVEFEDAVYALVNEHRASGASCGGREMPAVPALRLDPTLVCTARAHSQDMLEQDYFEHDSPDGRDPGERIRAAGYEFRAMGENIALGQPTPEAVMETWMQSSGHCENIMSENFEDIGVGYATAGGRTHLWTQNFGRR